LTQLEEQQEREVDPYTLFAFSLRSPYTKETYFRRLRRFFDAIPLDGPTFEERCNSFAAKGKIDPAWAFNLILRFVQSEKERVEGKKITAGTLRNSVKTIKTFCEVTDVTIAWKKISRGLPRAKRYADDRAPTLDEIRKLAEYPDRRMKPIIYIMASSGIRVGAWDYLKWGHIVRIEKDGKVVAAKMIVYSGEADEYFTFISSEAYTALESWINYRKASREYISSESWVMRTLWNSTRPKENSLSNKLVNDPEKLNSVGVKRLIERALWTQGLRAKLAIGKKRHEFQTDHGFRKWFKTQCEIAGMRPINVEILMGHSVGISDSYYRATENELLVDYLKALDFVTLSYEHRLEKNISEIEEQSSINDKALKSELYANGQQISMLTERDSLNSDAIAALSDQVMNLMKEIETLKKKDQS
jgi:integrase